jgi:hypothetical protein
MVVELSDHLTMNRRIAVALILLLLAACQTTSGGSTHSDDCSYPGQSVGCRGLNPG